jgi:outer membrane protein assembly factor BamE
MRRPLTFAVGLTLLSAGCVYRPPILQGNFLGQKKVSQLKQGMTRGQVEYLLGTPMVEDPFHQQRWDYVYFLQPSDWGKADKEHRLIIYFKNGRIARIAKPSKSKRSG